MNTMQEEVNAQMDVWQSCIYKNLIDFIEFGRGEDEQIAITRQDAYVLIKALEDQQRYDEACVQAFLR